MIRRGDAARRLDLLDDVVGRRHRFLLSRDRDSEVIDDDRGALCRQSPTNLAADTAPAASHGGHLAFKMTTHCRYSPLRPFDGANLENVAFHAYSAERDA